MYDTFLRHQEQDVRAFKESGPEIKKKKEKRTKPTTTSLHVIWLAIVAPSTTCI
jgi:hypothetical protein